MKSAARQLRRALLAGLVATAAVTTAPPAGAATPTHPEQDEAGAQIARYEGTRSDVRSGGYFSDDNPLGLDVSSHQGNVDWDAASRNGATFAYIKATEGTTYTNPYFTQQYNGSYQAGMIHGAYHFALPNASDGVTQANYFVDHGGGWSSDGRTLPPALDIEYNPYGEPCYQLDPAAMTAWIRAFSDQILARTGRPPMIYTSTTWWSKCTGNNDGFSANPLWLPRYGDSIGTLPNSWHFQTIWQFADKGVFPGDQNRFNGPISGLRTFATG
ncbi:MAG: lysozyme [Kutzneria sp.]|nr:lysozyme [Kutzneria sp.]